jgi:hypothetical protein
MRWDAVCFESTHIQGVQSPFAHQVKRLHVTCLCRAPVWEQCFALSVKILPCLNITCQMAGLIATVPVDNITVGNVTEGNATVD